MTVLNGALHRIIKNENVDVKLKSYSTALLRQLETEKSKQKLNVEYKKLLNDRQIKELEEDAENEARITSRILTTVEARAHRQHTQRKLEEDESDKENPSTDKTFASEIIKFQTEELKKYNKTQGLRNATLSTSQCNDDYYDELLPGTKSHKTVSEEEDREDQENSQVDEDDEFPSDLTFDHHPQRTADYFLLHDDSEEIDDKQSDDDDWINYWKF